MVKTWCFLAGVLVQSLLRELGSHKLCSQKELLVLFFSSGIALFGSLCHILIVLEVFPTFSFVLFVRVISDL